MYGLLVASRHGTGAAFPATANTEVDDMAKAFHHVFKRPRKGAPRRWEHAKSFDVRDRRDACAFRTHLKRTGYRVQVIRSTRQGRMLALDL